MRTLVSLTASLLAIASMFVFLSFTHASTGRGKTELRVGLVDPWLTRQNHGGKVTTRTNPLSWSAFAGAGAVVLFVGSRLVRRKRPESYDDEPPPAAPEHTPVDDGSR